MAASAQAIKDPKGLRVPPPADFAIIKEWILTRLTDAGARTFMIEMFEASIETQATGYLRPMSEVLESWARTITVVNDPGFEDAWTKATPPFKRLEEAQEWKKLTH